jgi:putative transposase
MPRLSRRCQWTDTACYHILNRGHDRQAVFADDIDATAFLQRLNRYLRRFTGRLYHYCLMPNHFHLLLHLSDARQLSAFMAGLLRSYGHHVARRHAFVGPLWQGRFKSPAVQREGYWLSCGRYIERNPKVAGLAARPWDYPWSSAAFYTHGRGDELLTPNPCYEELAADAASRRRLWHEFLCGDDPREAEVERAEWATGDAAFRSRLVVSHGRPLRRRGRPSKLVGA